MSTADKPTFSDRDDRKVLLVGDVGKAFLDAGAITEGRCELCSDMADAIDAVRKNSFAAIGVVMAGIPASLKSALTVLRQSSPKARIILLAQMYEEPIAIQLVGSAVNGRSVADDYLICPVEADEFYESIQPARGYRETETVSFAPVDATLERRIKQLEKLATEDDLTGLKNRRYIREFSRQILGHARKENGRVTLLIFDIDNFKHYNDVYGHSTGDKILQQAAVLMRRCCRAHDVVGRVGGDEFAVVFWDDPHRQSVSLETERRSAAVDHPTEAIFIARRFRKELERAEWSATGGLGPAGEGVLTISGGLASFPRDGSTVQELFQQADRALLEAKRSGKNRIYLVGKPQSDIADIE